MKRAILFTLTGRDPNAQMINDSSLVASTSDTPSAYTFHPTFSHMHTAGNRSATPLADDNYRPETEWTDPPENEPARWVPDREGNVGTITGYVGRTALYGELNEAGDKATKSFTVPADTLERLDPIRR